MEIPLDVESADMFRNVIIAKNVAREKRLRSVCGTGSAGSKDQIRTVGDVPVGKDVIDVTGCAP